jgi:hypothetical protein
MTGRVIYEHEIKSCQDAADHLLSNEGDPRTNYQKIFHTLEGCKDRFVDVPPKDEKKEFHRCVRIIARYIVNHAVELPASKRDEYFRLAHAETKRQIMNETKEEFSKR